MEQKDLKVTKQIEEIVKDLREAQHAFDAAWTDYFQNKGRLPEKENVFYATHLYNAGYRKQSEGEWTFEHECYGKMLCSNCKAEALVNERSEYVDSDFCPNCGAKMQRKEDEGK